VGFVLWGVAWLFSTPPFQAPDESAQYLRALTIADGALLGPREPLDQSGAEMLLLGDWHAVQERWIIHDRRGVVVPARLSPPGPLCLNDRPDLFGSCTEVTYTGDYYPLGYLLPAAAISAASHATTALWLGRAASLLLALAWLVVALALSGPALGWRPVGVLAACTPTVFFIGSVLNPSGLELTASLAFISGLSRLLRDGPDTRRWVWWALGLSGATTILAWQPGPLFVLADLAVFGALARPRGLRALRTTAAKPLTGTVLGLLGAIALFVLWGAISGSLHSDIGFTPLGSVLRQGWDQLGPTLREAVGGFGALTVKLPAAMCWGWWAIVLGLLLGAFVVGTVRERIILLITLIGVLAFPVLLYAFVQRNTGFGMQGRYVLPLLALIPITSASILEQKATRTANLAPAILTAALAGFQLASWWINAHHWKTTANPLHTGAHWTPPISWSLLLLIALLGTIAVATAAILPIVKTTAARPLAHATE
jgi:hypothetical protein